MKALTSFIDLGTVTASGSAAGFDPGNIEDLDPGVKWKADAYAGDVWLLCDMGSAKAPTGIFFNRANFPAATVQGNATNSWGSPSFSQAVALSLDEAGNRKGWFDLAAFNYRYLRVLIAGGQALDSGSVPELGNLIVGISAALPRVAEWAPELVGRMDRFEADSGAVRKEARGLQRHVIQVQFADALATLLAMSKTWEHAVFFEDLGSAAGAWLVMRPDSWGRPVRSTLDATMRVTLEERV